MKRVVLLSLGLTFMTAGFVGCLPSDSGGTGTGGMNGQGTGGSGVAGTQGTGGSNPQGTGGDQQGTGGSNPQGTGGSNPQGTGGNQQGTGGTNPQGTGGTAGGTGGTNPQGAAGRGGAGGTAGGAAGRGGAGGTAGTGGTAGGAAGRGGAAGTGTGGSAAGTTGTGGTGNVAGPLDGAMLLGPCLANTQAAVCATISGQCPAANTSDPALSGVHTTDKMITLGGDPATTYTIVLHVQGEVESKNYNGGTDVSTAGMSPTLNGWRYPAGTTNPTPNTGNAYNVYMLRVTNMGATTHQDYMLNSLDPPGVENHTTYGMDYTTPAAGQAGAFTANGGATIRMVAADSNCSMIKNCGPTANDGNTCAAPIVLQNLEPSSVAKNPTFNGGTNGSGFTSGPYNGQWILITVKSVSP